MIVNELFYSLQGEGRLAGRPSVFIRLAGCPLRCSWCDTKYAWDPAAGRSMSCDQILQHIYQYPTRYVVLTGGEPLVHDGIQQLTQAIASEGFHLTVETSGIQFIQGLHADLMSLSPKLSNSQSQEPSSDKPKQRFNVVAIQEWISAGDYQLKFVVDAPNDLDEIAEVLAKLENVDPYRVYLMPQATESEEYLEKSRWLVEYCKQTGFSFSPRLQVMLWGPEKGK